jgi:hypothetical protein
MALPSALQPDVSIVIQRVIWPRIVRKVYFLQHVIIVVNLDTLESYAQLLETELVSFVKVLVMLRLNVLSCQFERVTIVVIMGISERIVQNQAHEVLVLNAK